MSTKETIHTNKKSVSCKGKEDSLGHPHIYLEIDDNTGYIECPYCSKKFIYKDIKS